MTGVASFGLTFPIHMLVIGTAVGGVFFGLPWYISVVPLAILIGIGIYGKYSVAQREKSLEEKREALSEKAKEKDKKICLLFFSGDRLSVRPNFDNPEAATKAMLDRFRKLRDNNDRGIYLEYGKNNILFENNINNNE